jgi:catechol 2,3-dioxygenase-like lactoylglutathione lyase family enzyme
MLKGLNHLTLAVSNIAGSIDFYHHLLGLPLHARWDSGAYLSCGDLWLCLSLDAQRHYIASQESDYTHYAFSIDENDFAAFVARLTQAGVTSWKENKSEGESFYFSTRTGTSWKPTWATRSGWPPAARSRTREWCFLTGSPGKRSATGEIPDVYVR